jgi:hypothetical protein
MLQECREAVRKHLGIEKRMEVENSLEGFKDLIERMIKANTKIQHQVTLLQKDKEDAQQQFNITSNEIQKIHEQTSMTMVTEYNNLKGFRQNVEKVSKQATVLNSVVSD